MARRPERDDMAIFAAQLPPRHAPSRKPTPYPTSTYTPNKHAMTITMMMPHDPPPAGALPLASPTRSPRPSTPTTCPPFPPCASPSHIASKAAEFGVGKFYSILSIHPSIYAFPIFIVHAVTNLRLCRQSGSMQGKAKQCNASWFRTDTNIITI